MQKKIIKGEVDHCKDRLMRYCRGQGIDIGCGASKIRDDAIGIDLYHPEADVKMDARDLRDYPDGHFDYAFSSHLLEEFENTEATLKEWLRIIKPGGNLVLYQADKSLYYPLNDPQCNHNHKHHFDWEDLWSIFQRIGGVDLIHHGKYPERKEWSFELVIRKHGGAQLNMDSTEGISILIPTLHRPQGMDDTATSIDVTANVRENIEILFGIHNDDLASIEKAKELGQRLKIKIRCEIIDRYKDGKAHLSFLWNQLYARAGYNILGYFGDDVIFHTPGWDEEVRGEFFKDKTIMVSCNDVHVQKGKIATLFFTHKCVHEKFGFYLNSNFRRWYTDTYWDNIFRRAKKMHYREDIVTEHLHPDAFPERVDAVYKDMDHYKGSDRIKWACKENQEEINRHARTLREFNPSSTPG